MNKLEQIEAREKAATRDRPITKGVIEAFPEITVLLVTPAILEFLSRAYEDIPALLAVVKAVVSLYQQGGMGMRYCVFCGMLDTGQGHMPLCPLRPLLEEVPE